MKELTMRLKLFVTGFTLLAVAAFASPQDFSDGLTGISSDPAVAKAAGVDPEWAAKQSAVEKAAAEALQSGKVATPAGLEPGQLAPGDKIKMTIFGEEDMSGEFDIDNTGSLAVPLLGEVKAMGLTPRELEKRLMSQLNQGYLVNARVNIEVLNFRPFFILGEVNKPGRLPMG